MAQRENSLAKYRLDKSYEAIADAEILLQKGSTAGAVSMGLRAARHAAEAALVADGNGRVRTESLLKLTAEFVRDGRLTQDSFNAFRAIMDLCLTADERDFSAVGRSEAKAAIDNVKYFVREMGEIVNR